jgi:chromosome segregation ATPase
MHVVDSPASPPEQALNKPTATDERSEMLAAAEGILDEIDSAVGEIDNAIDVIESATDRISDLALDLEFDLELLDGAPEEAKQLASDLQCCSVDLDLIGDLNRTVRELREALTAAPAPDKEDGAEKDDEKDEDDAS